MNKLDLINEQTSPLFRIMWVTNDNEPLRRSYENNICAFHVGKGVIISVAHNLRSEAPFFRTIDESAFQGEIVPNVSIDMLPIFNKVYILDANIQKRYVNLAETVNLKKITDELKRINYDCRWIALKEKHYTKPYLIIQFRDNQFYNNPVLTAMFKEGNYFHEPTLNRHTFIMELELVDPIYSEDIAIYKIINTEKALVDKLPSVEINYNILDSDTPNFYCLQSAPVDSIGRLLNDARIEGILDNWNVFRDRFGGNYMLEGLRYLIKGYFRFGSSGAPYIVYDTNTNTYKANAVQSEASGIQLAINNNRDGNFQYVNAIASPLANVKDSIDKVLQSI
jgi:hypothetical protein